jgi:hypothetical protein
MLGNDFSIGRATVTSCDINTPKELLLDELKRADIIPDDTTRYVNSVKVRYLQGFKQPVICISYDTTE